MNTTYQHLTSTRRLKIIRICLWVMIIGLALSGITAFPLETELGWLNHHAGAFPAGMQAWLAQVYGAIHNSNLRYPYLSYGTDWLAFAHLVLALLFIGAVNNPVKNVWVIQFGLIACALIFPLAFIAGGIRGIPVFWQWVDCSFGIIGCIPLFIAYHHIKKLEAPAVQFNLNT
jgi:hypothetical protein